MHVSAEVSLTNIRNENDRPWITGIGVVASDSMKLEDYTTDAICRAMLLSGFIVDSWIQSDLSVLRLVLTPSFSPEVCLTLTHRDDQTLISVEAFVEQFWPLRSPAQYPPCNSENVICESRVFDQIVRFFEVAEEESKREPNGVCLDGMGIEACLVLKKSLRRFKFHMGINKEVGEFVDRTIAVAWTGCQDPQIRNALAHCSWGQKYPLDKIPEKRPVTKLAVLGAPSERNEYFEKLRLTKKPLQK